MDVAALPVCGRLRRERSRLRRYAGGAAGRQFSCSMKGKGCRWSERGFESLTSPRSLA